MGSHFSIPGLFVGHSHEALLIANILIVVFISLLMAKLATRALKVSPSGCQNVMEAYIDGVVSMGAGVMGVQKAKKYLPLVATIGIFVFIANVLGIIPGFESPTANINVTLPMALCVFLYYHYEGIKAQGFFTYFKHFAGPVPWLAPLMFPVEIISHLSRIISLSFRLFGNIKGDDMFLAVMLMLVPWVVPVVFLPYALLAFGAILQAFVFMILTYVYIGGAVVLEEEGTH
jgi:F-type H+-transporting ATPase subunit a